MQDNFSHLNEDERLEAENRFLKMKLMLEHDAKFSEEPDLPQSSLPPAIENEFLNRIIAFEEQSKNPKYIKVFDRIEKPVHFKPVAEIPDNEIEDEWKNLQEYLYRYHIVLDVCSPNIPARELYRFTIEELFEYEMNDMDLQGMVTNFIYDEFHPDPIYDNTRMVTEDCLPQIIGDRSLEWTHNFKENGLRLNDHYPISIEQLKQHVHDYRSCYRHLEIIHTDCASCTVEENRAIVKGTYSLEATTDVESIVLSGNWEVITQLDEEIGYWYIAEIQITGIRF